MHRNVKTLIVSGGIGSGKSFVCSLLAGMGYGVYDCDSRVKEIYLLHPELAAMVSKDIFEKPEKLAALETALFPVLKDDFERWAGTVAGGPGWVVMESATILDKSDFDGFGDFIVWVEAPQEVRLERAVGRATVSRESILERMKLQPGHQNDPRVGFVIDSSVPKPEVKKQVEQLLRIINNIE